MTTTAATRKMTTRQISDRSAAREGSLGSDGRILTGHHSPSSIAVDVIPARIEWKFQALN